MSCWPSPPGIDQAQWTAHLKDAVPGLFQKQGVSPKFAVAPLIAIGVGFAVDQIQSEIQKEAEVYDAQFSATVYERGFWQTLSNGRGTPRFYAFEIVRTAGGYEDAARPAYRLICAIASADSLPPEMQGKPNPQTKPLAEAATDSSPGPCRPKSGFLPFVHICSSRVRSSSRG
jgi:hypothetical protein